MKTNQRTNGGGRVQSDIGRFSMIPDWIIDARISDRAVKLFAILSLYGDQQGESLPSRTTLATRMRTSPASIDRATKELVEIGAARVTLARSEERSD